MTIDNTPGETGNAHTDPSLPLVKVVGVSAAGKSTLVRGLRAMGFDARPASQEHSDIPDMWRQLHPPQVLLYLDVSLAAQRRRRADVAWSAQWLQVEQQRLAHARRHAHLVIDTNTLGPNEVLSQAARYLIGQGIAQSAHPMGDLPNTGAAGPARDPAVHPNRNPPQTGDSP